MGIQLRKQWIKNLIGCIIFSRHLPMVINACHESLLLAVIKVHFSRVIAYIAHTAFRKPKILL